MTIGIGMGIGIDIGMGIGIGIGMGIGCRARPGPAPRSFLFLPKFLRESLAEGSWEVEIINLCSLWGAQLLTLIISPHFLC